MDSHFDVFQQSSLGLWPLVGSFKLSLVVQSCLKFLKGEYLNVQLILFAAGAFLISMIAP